MQMLFCKYLSFDLRCKTLEGFHFFSPVVTKSYLHVVPPQPTPFQPLGATRRASRFTLSRGDEKKIKISREAGSPLQIAVIMHWPLPCRAFPRQTTHVAPWCLRENSIRKGGRRQYFPSRSFADPKFNTVG